MIQWTPLCDGVISTRIFLPCDTISEITQQIQNDASNVVRVSTVVETTTTSETYTPSIWGDDYYEELFDKIDSVVNDGTLKRELTSSWVMRYTGDQNTLVHQHDRWHKVAIYYIDAPAGSGTLYFPEADPVLEITPVTGMLVVHDGNIAHGVRKNTIENIERYCAVLNYQLK